MSRKMFFKEEKSNRWNDAWWFNAYDNAAKGKGDGEQSETPKIYSGIEIFLCFNYFRC